MLWSSGVPSLARVGPRLIKFPVVRLAGRNRSFLAAETAALQLPLQNGQAPDQVKLLIWRSAIAERADIGGLSLDMLDQSNRVSSADAAPSGSSSPRRLSSKQTIRRPELRKIVPLADSTIYEMEQRGEFPRRFHLTSRCVVWNLAEVEAWIDARRRASETGLLHRAPAPDVRQRKTRPVRQ